jgi:quinol monooxygenase YgiN
MSDPITVIARYEAKVGQQARLRKELQNLVTLTRAEPGCILYDLHESPENPLRFAFYETWRSQADLDAHLETPHLKAIVKIAPEIVNGEIEITTWKKLK